MRTLLTFDYEVYVGERTGLTALAVSEVAES